MRKPSLNPGVAAITLALIAAGATAVHSSTSTEAVIKAAETDAGNASRALAKGKAGAAVALAEHAVQLRPQDATYRALLGKSYLAAGRFFSAKQAFADTLELDRGLPGVALNLALATIATGDFANAQQILDANAATISPADRGLAIALAGNPAGAVEILLPAARAIGSDAKTRQNLALAFALGGRWPEARQVALADLSPADADARIEQWAAFARPTAASDQVSALLGVTPVADRGQPVQLALVSAAAPVAEVVAPAPVAAPAPIVAVAAAAPAAIIAPVEAAPAAPRPAVASVVFAGRSEVVQALPAAPVVAAAKPVPVRESHKISVAAVSAVKPVRTAAPVTPAKGAYFVQIGAYSSAKMAKWGWDKVSARHKVLAGRTPYTMPIGNGLIRVAVGGFDRSAAVTMCRSLRAKGGACFVRAGAGDQVASWVKSNVQVAAAKAPRGRPSKRG